MMPLLLVRCLALLNLDVPQKQDEHDHKEYRRCHHRSTRHIVLDDVPDHENGGDQKQHGAGDRVQTFHLVHREIEEVHDEDDNVDEKDDKVETAAVAETTIVEALTTAVPSAAQQRAQHDADDNFDDFDDATVRLQITAVEANVTHC